MKLLQAEPQTAPAGPAPEAEQVLADGVVARACPSCGSGMDLAQDWCLDCGTAAPGRLGGRPGWRAATTVVGLTLLLVLGAVAASYAALTGEATQVAMAPPGPVATPTTQAPPSVPPAVTPPAPEATETLPEVAPPPTEDQPELPEPTAITPDVPTPAPTVTPAPTPSPTPAPSTTPEVDPVPAEPVAISLGTGDGSAYDPYKKIAEGSEPAKALDGKPFTSWTASAAEDADSLGFGYAVALGTPADVKELLITTKTPGFRVEVYGSTSSALPPDILDDRWIHLRDRADVDASTGAAPKDGNRNGDGKERMTLGDNAKGKALKHVLLWFTQVPENGPTIRLTQLELRA